MEEVAQTASNGFIVFTFIISYVFVGFICYLAAISNLYKHSILYSVFWVVFLPYIVIMEVSNKGHKLIESENEDGYNDTGNRSE